MVFLWFLPSCILASEKASPLIELHVPPPISPEQEKARNEKERQESEAAIAKLPVFDRNRLKHIIDVLGQCKFPIRFQQLQSKLGVSDTMLWCCTRETEIMGHLKVGKSDVFQLSDPKSLNGVYELIVDYQFFTYGNHPDTVTRARLCFQSPLGWRFRAETMDEILETGPNEAELSAPSNEETKPVQNSPKK